MKLHLSLIRKLPAHLRSGMLAPAHPALAMSDCGDAGKNPAYARIQKEQDWFGSVALAGSGSM